LTSRRPRRRCLRSSAGLADGKSVRAVWVNEEGGVTFRLGSDILGIAGREFIKVAKANTADFAGEAPRLPWAARYIPVPQVLGLDHAQTGIMRGYAPARCPACPRYTHAGWQRRTWRCERSVRACACCTTDCRCGHARSTGQ
jgi:hypothetical protein